MNKNITIDSIAPHIRTKRTTNRVMMDVLIALVPALIGSVYFFGFRSLLLICAAVISCVLSELICEKLTGKKLTIKDLSAVVTGVLLAFNVPVTTPVWIVVIAGIFSIVVVKQFFGGIGNNFLNPALSGRLFIMILWPQYLIQYVPTNHAGTDAVSSATVLTMLKSGQELSGVSYFDMFIGNIPGALGETSKLLLLIGFIYLIVKKIVNIKITIAYIGTVAAMTWIFAGDSLFTGNVAAHLLSGGLFLGAFFMLTDYSFVTAKGMVLLGITAGLITALIRIWGSYAEGVCFGILITNCLVFYVEKLKKQKVYGVSKTRQGRST